MYTTNHVQTSVFQCFTYFTIHWVKKNWEQFLLIHCVVSLPWVDEHVAVAIRK